MTPRDRMVLLVVAVVAIAGGGFFMFVKPPRDEAKTLDTAIVTAQARVDTATATADAGEAAKERYADDYASVARLGKAVPVDDEVPALVVQLQSVSDRAKVDFRSIELSAGGVVAAPAPANSGAQVAALGAAQNGTSGAQGPASGTSGATGATGPAGASAAVPATQVAAAGLPPGAAVGPAGFPTMPFDFAFNGSFFRLQDLLSRLDAFTELAGDKITVRGRLLTVDGFSLLPGPKGFPQMKASVHATAYLLPEGTAASAAGAPPVAAPATPVTTR